MKRLDKKVNGIHQFRCNECVAKFEMSDDEYDAILAYNRRMRKPSGLAGRKMFYCPECKDLVLMSGVVHRNTMDTGTIVEWRN